MAADPTQQQLALIFGADSSHFESLISNLLSSTNEQRSQAESLFNLCLQSHPDALFLKLAHLLQSSPNPEARTMSTILLRRQLTRQDAVLWPQLAPSTQSSLKLVLLNSLQTEDVKSIIKKLCDTISELASVILLDGGWPELLPFMFQCVTSDNLKLQEAALLIFAQLAHYIGETLVPQLSTLHTVFLQCLTSSKSSDVRIAALGASINFIQCLSSPSDRDRFQDLLPLMMQTLTEALNCGQEATAQEALELLIELAGTEPRFLRRQIVDVVSSMLQIAEAESLEEGTRHLAIEFVITLAEARERAPGMMRKFPQFIQRLFAILMNMLLDIEDDPAWHSAETEDEDAGETSNYGFGQECLDRLSISLGGNTIVPVASELLPTFLAAPDWKKHHAALIAFAQIAEGCSKVMTKNLEQVVSMVLNSFKDAHPRVRWAAINAIGQLSTDLGPELQVQYHHVVLPALVGAMDDFQNPRVQAHAASAVLNFTENCTPEILTPYLDGVVTKLLVILQNGKQMVQEGALTALASVADSSQEQFQKYYDAVMPYLKAILMNANDKSNRMLRAKAMECISLVGMAVGKKFREDAKQKSRAVKRVNQDSKANTTSKSSHSLNSSVKETEVNKLESNPGRRNTADDCAMSKEITNESKSTSSHGSVATIKKKGNKGWKDNPRKKSREFYEMGVPDISLAAKKDQDLERKLAKKLKVKGGRLRGMDDGLNIILDGMSSIIDFMGEGEVRSDEFPSKKSKKRSSNNRTEDDILSKEGPQAGSIPVDTSNQDVGPSEFSSSAPSSKKHKKRKLVEQRQEGNDVNATAICVSKPAISCEEEASTMHVPALVPEKRTNQKYIAPHLRARAGNEPEEHTQIRRRIRGLLNRLSESNVESITGEISTIFRTIARSVASQIISEEILASCSGGPRGNEQYAAVFAAFVAGMACLVGIDFSAKFMASFAKCFEDESNKEDNLSLRNLTLLLCYLCIFGVCSSDLIYDFLIMLSKQLTEIDVSTILTVLQCCGMKIRADDPAAMKDFILSVQNRTNELKASDCGGQEKIYSKRMEFMLETICDIKNNKKRPKEDPAHHTRIKKWLQKLRVDDILLRGFKWNKLLDPDKKGQWWLSGDAASATDNVAEVANRIDKDVVETQRMLQLAAAQRMNTDTRRAIFCIIMSGDDYIDAFEKLLRLDLPGKQDREIMRVLLECCLQEKVFNKYYTVLASKLCEHDKNHKFTLQFCLWDHFKELESMELMRSIHLAKFVAEMVASFTLSLAVLKTIELGDITQLTPKKIMHSRMFFESIFEYSDSQVWNMFTRVAVTPELESLRQGIEFFIKEYILKANKALTPKFKLAKKALHNLEGVLM